MGGFLVYFAGGFAPGTPALNRLRHLQSLPNRCPAVGLPLRGTGYPYHCGKRNGGLPLRGTGYPCRCGV